MIWITLVYFILQCQLICSIITFIELLLWGKTLQQYTTIFVSKIFKIKYYKLKDSDYLYEKNTKEQFENMMKNISRK